MVEFRAMSVNCYSAYFEFFPKSVEARFASSTQIQFTAISRPQAIADAIRFWKDRHKNMPEHFRELLYVNICTDRIGPIDDVGRISHARSSFFEWKADFPARLEEYAAEFERKEKSL